jgi:hypothetical protein
MCRSGFAFSGAVLRMRDPGFQAWIRDSRRCKLGFESPWPAHAGAGCRLGSQTSACRCANRPVGSRSALHAAARWFLRPQPLAHACVKPLLRAQFVPDRCAERRERPAHGSLSRVSPAPLGRAGPHCRKSATGSSKCRRLARLKGSLGEGARLDRQAPQGKARPRPRQRRTGMVVAAPKPKALHSLAVVY